MRYATAAALRQALETRLLALSRSQGSSLVRLRKEVVFDRLLARLLVTAPGRWVLKGGLAWGWGDIPDQYRRRWDADDGESRPPADPGLSDLPPLRPRWGLRDR